MDVTPTIRADGVAKRDVDPDRVAVVVRIKTIVKSAQRQALERALELRNEISQEARSRFPDAKVTDTRIDVSEHQIKRETEDYRRVETEWVVDGYFGACSIRVEDAAERAAEVVAAFGAGEEYGAASPSFFLSEALRTQVVAELESEAVRAARAKAERLAAAAGCTLGAVLAIGEDEMRERAEFEVFERRAFGAVDHEAAFQDLVETIGEVRPEPITVSASVPVRFALTER